MAIRRVLLMIGLGCVVVVGTVGASSIWNSRVEREAKRWQLEERASQLKRENARLVQQIGAQHRSTALLRAECSPRTAAAEARDNADAPSGETEPSTTHVGVQLRQIGNRIEVAPGGPMVPISD
jgi:hypothetical protein